ncbi:cilia- and flagella-associated protein 45-like [Syngnathoides biaculeatus]|uniref:cilia- and flagella-associated protein 45-like n=1 Tax=Syngnathoides biaculeatus TaxID=300417 RepID=UPI002ADE7F32|nr:cilia- and flagella-associated protein 45-like [Syngnathoides biaculeatus]
MDLTFKKPQKKTVICHQGFLYNIRMPRDDSDANPVVLTIPEHQRILANARGPNAIEREFQALRNVAQKKQEEINAAQVRRNQIMQKDMCTMKQEEETKKKSEKQAYLEYQRHREKAQLAQDTQILKLDRWILNSKIQAERDKQLSWKKRCEEVEHSREKAEFDRVLTCTKIALAQEGEKNKNRQEDGRKHLEFIKQQVREREEEALLRRRERLTDFIRVKEDWKEKDKWMTELKEDRLQELNTSGVPEEYRVYVTKKTVEDSVNLMDSQYRTYKTYDILPRWVTDSTRAMKEHIKSQNVEMNF